MNFPSNHTSHIVFGLALLGAVVLNCILLSQIGGATYWFLIVLILGMPPLAVGAALFIRRAKPSQPSPQATPPSILFWVVTAAIGCTLAVGGVLSGHLWLMMIGQLLPPVAASLRGQFSLRRMFGVVTLLAVCMGMVSALERWRDKTNREFEQRRVEIEQWRVERSSQIKKDSIASRRANLESKRDRLSPEFYEHQINSLDEVEQGNASEPSP